MNISLKIVFCQLVQCIVRTRSIERSGIRLRTLDFLVHAVCTEVCADVATICLYTYVLHKSCIVQLCINHDISNGKKLMRLLRIKGLEILIIFSNYRGLVNGLLDMNFCIN